MAKRAYWSMMFFFAMLLCTCVSIAPRNPTTPHHVYDSLFFEVHRQGKAEATAVGLREFKGLLSKYRIAKPDRVQFAIAPVTSDFSLMQIPGNPTWKPSKMKIFEEATRRFHDPDENDRHGIIYISYLGGSHKKKSVVGTCYGNTSMALFPDSMSRAKEGRILLHELGHIMGIPLDETRYPKNDGPHCANEDCIMYPRIASSAHTLCAKCVQDIRKLAQRHPFENR